MNLDDAWAAESGGITTIDALEWGPQLRFSAPRALIKSFFRAHESRFTPFTLYGSGDFHHLTALLLQRLSQTIVVVSFDNHPDWDIRPPKWCCGAWVNRALELPQVKKVSVWGCGNFECWWPGQAFGNRTAERQGRLEVHAWADERPRRKQQRRGAIFRATWRENFEKFVKELNSTDVYVTVDLDCLRSGEAVTNWENGRFSIDDVAWALGRLRDGVRIAGGDICGAYSVPKYARWKQRLVAVLDHPNLPKPDEKQARTTNLAALRKLWPLLARG
ncbi:MAG: hypothetical protein ABR589_03845 [Chthoniobacterales bacterium]